MLVPIRSPTNSKFLGLRSLGVCIFCNSVGPWGGTRWWGIRNNVDSYISILIFSHVNNINHSTSDELSRSWFSVYMPIFYMMAPCMLWIRVFWLFVCGSDTATKSPFSYPSNMILKGRSFLNCDALLLKIFKLLILLRPKSLKLISYFRTSLTFL